MFNINIYDQNFFQVGVIDVFKSLIWSERYQEAGEFELYIDPGSSEFKKIEDDYYIELIKDDNLDEHIKSLMIIEDFKIVTNLETGNSVSITGRSLSSILDRRIVWEPTWFSGSLQEGIKKIITENIISPKNESRKIDNFEFIDSNDHDILKLGVEIDTVGETVYEVINNICSNNGIGYKVLYDFNRKKITFELISGKNRGENNPDNNLVIEFSPRNDNLLESNYTKAKSEYKNVILIGGEGEGDKRYFSSLNDYKKGMKRKETFQDSNITFGDTKENRLTFPEYERQLKEDGKTVLKELANIEAFDGNVQAYTNYDIYKINRDFFLGDIVFIENEYNKKGNALISEIVESYDENGYRFIPTFSTIKFDPLHIFGTIYIDNENKIFTIENILEPSTIIWGDGSKDENVTGTISHTYSGAEGDYEGLYDFYIYMTSNKDIEYCPTFKDSKVLYKIEVPNGVQELQEKTFYNCTLLSQIVLPPSLKIINGEQMFYNCTNMYTIVLPNSITNGTANTFQNCTNLIECNFPYNCETAPSNYFNNCSKLKKVTFPGNSFGNVGIKTIQANVLNACPKITDIYFGSTITSINGGFFNGPLEKVRIEFDKYEPPSLNGNFPGSVSEITVPSSPKFDDAVIKAYKTAWPSYADKIKDKDGEPEESKTNDSNYQYANNSVDYNSD